MTIRTLQFTMDPAAILKKYWGHTNFRPLQEEIIRSVLEDKDTLALLPTGGGKSICFQVPALMMEGICLVVSPLIALMKDQVQNLQNKGIPVLAIYSGMSYTEIKQILRNASFGNYKFLYVSPERLETELFLEFLPSLKPSLIAVDEAHCISQWGYDFRPSYMRIAKLREELPGVPVIALTASATPAVQEDICKNLLFRKNSTRFEQSFVRAELSYSAFTPASKEKKLAEILQNVKGSSIIYCRSRKETMKICELLRMQNIQADFYHAGLPSEVRAAKQDAWINNKNRIIVCTNAFGMGIDKHDVRSVIHYGIPDCLENYYQEAGRAGRDNKRAYAVLLYYRHEREELLQKPEIRYPSRDKIRKIYTALMNFLQVAAGSGEGITYDMDIALFAQHFKFNILEATYGIQALAQEGLVSYSETNWRQASVEFTISKTDLLEFEQLHPELEPLVKGLLRSYEGIFDYPCIVYENLLAKFVKISREELVKDLNVLNSYGIIRYKAASERPQILLLQNRMYADDFKIDQRNLSLRKQQALTRTNAMITFATEEFRCRNKMIADYFGDNTARDCNICDNCINNNSARLSEKELENAIAKITSLLHEEALSISEVMKKMKPVKERSVWMLINFLLGEEIIYISENDVLTLKKDFITSKYGS